MIYSRRHFLAVSTYAAATCAVAACGCGQAGASGLARIFAPPGELKVKYHGPFRELPVGTVTAGGWIKGWLDRQVTGLSGHPENLGYPYNTAMLAGKIEGPTVPHGEDWWRYEQSGYFVDGAVRLNLVTKNAAAGRIPADNLRYILANSAQGKLGDSTHGWTNTIIGRALMAQYGATGDTAIAEALKTCVDDPRPALSRDGFLAEEKLYVYGLTGDKALLAQAAEAYGRFFISDPKSFSHEAKLRGDAPLREHGVTAAEQLKLLPLMYLYTGDEKAMDLARLAYDKVVADSLMPDGGIVSSESLGTAAFNSLHETCDITDWAWSFGYMLMASGEARWGDLIERAAFNALPGAVTKDFRQLQYFSAPNQVLCSNTACARIAPTRMSYRAAHDTECCSGNVNRFMPNYVSRMWMRSDDGIAAVLYGPCEVRTTVKGRAVHIAQDTDYPFRDTIRFTIGVDQPASFTLRLRIPEWCSGARLRVNDKAVEIAAKAGSFAALKRTFHDGDVVELRLPMEVELEDWFGGKAVTVRRGPLVYAMNVAERRVESLQDSAAIAPILKGNAIAGFPAVEFFPDGEWRYGVAQGLTAERVTVRETPVGDNPFLADTTPVRLEVPVRLLPWWAAAWVPVIEPPPANPKAAPKNPTDLPSAGDMASAGPETVAVFVPYGATHLRLTTLPVVPA